MSALLLVLLAAAARAQIMDYSCMQATRHKTEEILKSYEQEGKAANGEVFGAVKQWSKDVEREGKAVQDEMNARVMDARREADGSASVRDAAEAARSAALDPSSADASRRALEARERWQKERAEATVREMYGDTAALGTVQRALEKQGDWNRTEVGLKGRLYEAEPPASAVAKHDEAAEQRFESKSGYSAGEAIKPVIGRLAAMAAIAERLQLGDHDVVIRRGGARGFETDEEPVRVLLKAADLGSLHGDMAVSHVQQAAPPPEVRREAASGSGPAAEVMRRAAIEAAVGVHNIGRAEAAAAEVRRIVSDVPPPPKESYGAPSEAEQEKWARKVDKKIEEKAAELKQDPVWQIIVLPESRP